MWNHPYQSILNYDGKQFDLIDQFKSLMLGKFRIVLKISNIQSNLYVNGTACVVRDKKFGPIKVFPNTKILVGTDFGSGGSNTYPNISFKEGYCIVEVITDRFPDLDLKTYGMDIEILEFEKLNVIKKVTE